MNSTLIVIPAQDVIQHRASNLSVIGQQVKCVDCFVEPNNTVPVGRVSRIQSITNILSLIVELLSIIKGSFLLIRQSIQILLVSLRASSVLSFPSGCSCFVVLNRVLQATKPLSIASNAHVAGRADIGLRLPIRTNKLVGLFPSFPTKGLFLYFCLLFQQLDLVLQLGIFMLKPLQFIVVS